MSSGAAGGIRFIGGWSFERVLTQAAPRFLPRFSTVDVRTVAEMDAVIELHKEGAAIESSLSSSGNGFSWKMPSLGIFEWHGFCGLTLGGRID